MAGAAPTEAAAAAVSTVAVAASTEVVVAAEALRDQAASTDAVVAVGSDFFNSAVETHTHFM